MPFGRDNPRRKVKVTPELWPADPGTVVHVEAGLRSDDRDMPKFWDGHAAQRIADDLAQWLIARQRPMPG
jgi:hypothetical protein